jgi:phage tail sheath protein FI
MAGIWARVDATRGVHKAPANEVVRGALGLEYNTSKNEQDGLNPDGINVIRALNGSIRVWGARTLGGDQNEANGGIKYLNVRRLMNFLEESIDEGTQFAVFEPNSDPLWQRITRSVSAFLLGVWRDGALFGLVPEEAFRVICDETTNPPDVRDRGQVVTEVWVAPVKPAEFVIFRINQVSQIPQ